MILLPTDFVELFAPGHTDGHGWRLPQDAEPYWSGGGSLQLAAGRSDPRARTGGFGPSDPIAAETGVLYLPPAASPAEGSGARIRGSLFTLSQVRLVSDPTGGGLGCWAATVSAAVAEEVVPPWLARQPSR
jgi:hypothetical protein